MDPQFERKIRFLQSADTDSLPHSERGLLDHLLGTCQLLLGWGASQALADAGLFHSVYGTEHYLPAALPISKRDAVRNPIGDEAEMLAWLFCVMRRETFDENLNRGADFGIEHRLSRERIPLSHAHFLDLVNLTFANTLEAMPRLSWRLRRSCRAYLQPFSTIAMPGAQRALASLSPRWWQLFK